MQIMCQKIENVSYICHNLIKEKFSLHHISPHGVPCDFVFTVLCILFISYVTPISYGHKYYSSTKKVFCSFYNPSSHIVRINHCEPGILVSSTLWKDSVSLHMEFHVTLQVYTPASCLLTQDAQANLVFVIFFMPHQEKNYGHFCLQNIHALKGYISIIVFTPHVQTQTAHVVCTVWV